MNDGSGATDVGKNIFTKKIYLISNFVDITFVRRVV